MKLLTNGSGEYLTGDDIADAVLNYGTALANARRVDLVDIPYVAALGRVGSVRMTVGWRAQLNAASHDYYGIELIDGAVVSDLRTRISALTPSGDMPLGADELSYLARADEF